MAGLNLSLCDVPQELHNISNLSALCSPGPPAAVPHVVMTIIQIFYAIICLLGLVGGCLTYKFTYLKIASFHFYLEVATW